MAKNCVTGVSCKATCISKDKSCRETLSSAAGKALHDVRVVLVKAELTEEEKEELAHFSEIGFDEVNPYLWEGRPAGPYGQGLQVANLDSALSKIPDDRSGDPLYRLEAYGGEEFGLDPERQAELRGLKVGDTYSSRSYMSFSKIPMEDVTKLAETEGLEWIPSVEFRTEAVWGDTPALSVVFKYTGTRSKPISEYSAVEKEKENLLPRDHPTVVKSIRREERRAPVGDGENEDIMYVELGDG